jgi:hypothetical protein
MYDLPNSKGLEQVPLGRLFLGRSLNLRPKNPILNSQLIYDLVKNNRCCCGRTVSVFCHVKPIAFNSCLICV